MKVRINIRQKIAMDDDDETITAAQLSAGNSSKKVNFTKTNSFLNSPFARPHHFLPFLRLSNLPSASIAV